MEFYNSHDGVRRISADHAATGALSVDNPKNAITFVKTSSSNKRKCAFTLAEVLITLGIIGIIAAMTLPSLIEKHQKKVVVTRLQKFYTNINQAIKLSEVDNGPAEYWNLPATNNVEATKEFYNKYLAKYLKTNYIGSYHENNINNDGSATDTVYNYLLVKFTDGSAMIMRGSDGIDIGFYPYASKVGKSDYIRDIFYFQFYKSRVLKNEKNFVEPYSFSWNGTREYLFSHARFGCRKNAPSGVFCAKLIQYDGWEIKDDYPW